MTVELIIEILKSHWVLTTLALCASLPPQGQGFGATWMTYCDMGEIVSEGNPPQLSSGTVKQTSTGTVA